MCRRRASGLQASPARRARRRRRGRAAWARSLVDIRSNNWSDDLAAPVPTPSRRSRARKPRRPVPHPAPSRARRPRAVAAASPPSPPRWPWRPSRRRRAPPAGSRSRRRRGRRTPRRRRRSASSASPRRASARSQVIGATSGAHPGRLRAYSRPPRARASSPPAVRRRASASRVVVRIRGRRRRCASPFTVAHLGRDAAGPEPHRHPARQAPALRLGARPACRRASRSTVTAARTRGGDLPHAAALADRPPRQHATRSTISPVGPGGPMIVDGRGRASSGSSSSRRPTSPPTCGSSASTGERVLTWWQGPVTAAAFGLGEGVIADTLLPHDPHRPRRQRLPDGPPRVRADARRRRPVHDLLAGAGPPARHAGRHAARRSSTRSSSRSTSRPASWSGSGTPYGHIPLRGLLRDARQQRLLRRLPHQLDPGAAPAVASCISARDTSAVYDDRPRAPGTIVWTLGGKASDFRLGRGARFWFQHDARMLPRRPDQPVRRRGRAAAEGALLARAGPARSTGATARRDGRRAVPPRARHLGPERGQRADLAAAATCSSASASSPFFSEFTRDGRLLFDAQPARGRRQLPRLPLPLERDAADPARRRGPAHRAGARRRSTRAGTARRASRAGRCSAARSGGPARADRRRPPGAGSRRASTWPRPRPVRGAGAGRDGRRAGDLGAGDRAVTAPAAVDVRLTRRVAAAGRAS